MHELSTVTFGAVQLHFFWNKDQTLGVFLAVCVFSPRLLTLKIKNSEMLGASFIKSFCFLIYSKSEISRSPF